MKPTICYVEQMKKVKNPHDRYFKKAMSIKKVAKDFFEQHLATEILDHIDLNTLSLQSNSFVSKKLKSRFSDLLYQVMLDGKSAYLYLLVEHQNKAEKLMPLRILEYQLDIMRMHCERHKTNELPIVVPMVFYNGDQTYSYSTDIFALFGASQHRLAKLCLLQPFHLVDLTQIEDDELRRHAWSGLMEMLMKYAHKRDLYELLNFLKSVIIDINRAGEEEYLAASLYYSFYCSHYSLQEVSEMVDFFIRDEPEMGEVLMSSKKWIGEEYFDMGMERGMEQGIELGAVQRERELTEALVKEGVDPSIIHKVVSRQEKVDSE